jgi:hypothetical protein
MPLPSFLGVTKPLKVSPAAKTLAIAAAPAATPNPLAFNMQLQQQTEWCWAATAASVAAYYKDPAAMTQCQIATACLSMNCCINPLPDPPPPTWAGNRTFTLNVALGVVNHFTEPVLQRAIDFPAIVAEIDAGRPVCCHISWDPGSPLLGHFNVIAGYDAARNDVVVRDPSGTLSDGVFPYESFKSNYHGGRWDQTYLTHE